MKGGGSSCSAEVMGRVLGVGDCCPFAMYLSGFSVAESWCGLG